MYLMLQGPVPRFICSCLKANDMTLSKKYKGQSYKSSFQGFNPTLKSFYIEVLNFDSNGANPPLKCQVFKCFWYLDVRYWDPHCI